MTTLADLRRRTDAQLIDALPPRLRATLDLALLRHPPASVLAAVRRATGGPTSRPGGLTYLMCEAYLDGRSRGGVR